MPESAQLHWIRLSNASRHRRWRCIWRPQNPATNDLPFCQLLHTDPDPLEHFSELPDAFEQYAQGRISTTGSLSGGALNVRLNKLEVPWIWSIIDFSAAHANSGTRPLVEHEIFPNYD